MKRRFLNNGIPVALSLDTNVDGEVNAPVHDKRRIITISVFALLIAAAVCFIAKFLVLLIDVITNLAFYGRFTFNHHTPAENHLGIWVLAIPALGGLVVGLMALFGSKAIRGHGIPEAMEQILTNQSKIKPTITYLKPISSAIAIGTGGPFGAEGPIIATGGALGSTIGQLIRISPNERKILLAAGATAGMSAIFGSPIAAIFLAIELLLFEFSARSILPIALACITGAAGHHFLFDGNTVFTMATTIAPPSNTALFVYSVMGLVIGVLSVGITKIVYLIEDAFEKLPIHWWLWPAIGGLAVGLIGYYSPRTMGVGYNNITDLLGGNLPLQFVISLCLLKALSWAIALGSGTSGGTLAPLLTIGSGIGIMLGSLALYFFPSAGLSLPLAALVGMSALFAGASRALLTSIIFALETTGQSNALLPLLAGCIAAYFVSFLLMENTIMTEKIVRRGVKTPHSYEPNLLENIRVDEVIQENGLVLSDQNTIAEVREWLENEPGYKTNFFVVITSDNHFRGTISSSNLFNSYHDGRQLIGSLIKRDSIFITAESTLQQAVEMMARENVDVLPVVASAENRHIMGIISYREIIAAYNFNRSQHSKGNPAISLRRQGLKILVRGKKLMDIAGRKK